MKVINEKPNATKKGLRMTINDAFTDENGNVIALDIAYSQWRCYGSGIFRLALPIYMGEECDFDGE